MLIRRITIWLHNLKAIITLLKLQIRKGLGAIIKVSIEVGQEIGMSSTVLTGETLNALRMIVWGNNPREDVFQRWAQGCI